VAAGLIIAQGAVLTQQSSPVSANTGTQLAIFSGATLTSPGVYQAQAGTALQLAVSGAGFAANSTVDVTFNAPMGFNNTSGQHAAAPNLAVPQFQTAAPAGATPANPENGGFEGDAIETAPAGTSGYVAGSGPNISPNSISDEVLTNAQGALIGGQSHASAACTAFPSPALCPGNPAVFNIPATAAPGRYTITGVDAGAVDTGSVTLVLTASPTNQMTVVPTAPSLFNGVGLGGGLNVTIPGGVFANGDVVRFAATDFAGFGFGGVAPPTLDDPTNDAFTPILIGAGAEFLQVLSCGASSGTTTESGPTFVTNGTNVNAVPPGFTAGAANNVGTTGCVASAGALSAQVQVRTDNVAFGTNGNTTLTLDPATGLLRLPDSVYSLVAVAFTQQTVSTVGGVNTYTYTPAVPGAPLKFVTAGVQLDHTVTRISLSTSQSAPGGSVSVRGFGFAANSPILVWLGAQQAPAAPIGGFVTTFPPGAGCAFALSGPTPSDGYIAASNGPAAPTPCLLGTTTTDSSGSFNLGATIPGATIATINSSVVLAEDFDHATAGTTPFTAPAPAGFPTVRLNAAAIAALGLNSTTTTGGLVVSPNPAAVGSTVTFTGTGYTPFENVTVSIVSGNCAVSTQVATVQAGPPLTSGGVANVVGSFVVPTNSCTVVATSGGTNNAGVTTTVSAVGGQSGLTTSTSLVIPPTAASLTLSPAPPAIPTTAVLTGSGFAANEPVSFQFGAADPFTGGASSLTVVVGQSDGNGNVTVSSPLPTGASTGLYSVTAIGLNSGFTVTGLQNVQSSGFLNCPTGSVLPGQQVIITGTSFSNTGLTSLFSPANGTGTLSINFAPTAVPATQIAISAAGTFTYTTTVPLGTTPGTYTVQFAANVSTGATTIRTCTITVASGITPTIVVTSGTTANLGATIPISLTGFAAGEPITVEFDYASTSPLSGQTVPGTIVTVGNADANGNFQGTYTIPASLPTLPPGQYNLVARGTQTTRSASVVFILNPSNASVSGVSAIYFPEGFTGTTAGGSSANFSETLNILNANNYTTTYTVTYFVLGAATPTVMAGTIGADSVVTRTVNTDVGSDKQVASEVSSPAPLAASRNIWRTDASGNSLDASSSLGVQLDTTSAVPTGGDNYYFATSDVQLTNEEYLSLLNPTATAETVTINVLPQSPLSSTTVPTIAPITVSVPAMGRVTEAIRKAVASSGITAFGLAINSTGPTAIERVEYYGDGIGSAKFGADTKPAVAGMGFRQYIFGADYGTAPSTGGTAGVGTGNDLSEVDIINPGAAAAGSATVTVSFFGPDGSPINSQQVQVDGGTRDTVAVNDVVGTQANVFSVVVTSDKNILAELPISFGGDPSKGGQFGVANPSGAPAGLTSVAFPNLNTSMTSPLSATTVVSQTVNLYNPGASAITVRGIYVSGTHMVNKTYTVAPNAITSVNVNADSAGLPAGPIGGIFQIVSTGAGSSDSFVAELVSASPDWKSVTADQGTYPTSAATGL
jgi:hypothetical protein